MLEWSGTAMLCYVTPKEHLGLAPDTAEQFHDQRLPAEGAKTAFLLDVRPEVLFDED